MAITNYQVVTSKNHADELAAAVNALIADGWQPFGGLQFDPHAGYAQAMVQSS